MPSLGVLGFWGAIRNCLGPVSIAPPPSSTIQNSTTPGSRQTAAPLRQARAGTPRVRLGAGQAQGQGFPFRGRFFQAAQEARGAAGYRRSEGSRAGEGTGADAGAWAGRGAGAGAWGRGPSPSGRAEQHSQGPGVRRE